MSTRSPVLFLIFNRPEVTAQVFDQIRAARPPRLYVAADGPRKQVPDEAQRCAETRQIVEKVNWPCEVKTLFREENLGCRDAVVSALDWLFSQEEEAIILEDDCLPAPDFFPFCDAMLEKYRDDPRVRHITGSNLQQGVRRGDASYYFSRLTHVWGWASWRRVWRDYDKDLRLFARCDLWKKLRATYKEPLIAEVWMSLFDKLRRRQIDTWDYQLSLANFFHGGLGVIPNVNLISNLGFGSGATHTKEADNHNSRIPPGRMGTLTHPAAFGPDDEADLFTLMRDFGIEGRRPHARKARQRVKRWFRNIGNRWRK